MEKTKFGNILKLWDFKREYGILGNVGQFAYLWGDLGLFLYTFNINHVRDRMDGDIAPVLGDVLKIGIGLTMKYYKRKKIIEKENLEYKLNNLEKRLDSFQ